MTLYQKITNKACLSLFAGAIIIGLSTTPVMADDYDSQATKTEISTKGERPDGPWWLHDGEKAKEKYESLSDKQKARVDKKRAHFENMSEEDRTAHIERMKERRDKMKAELEGLSPEERKAKMKEMRQEFKKKREERRAKKKEMYDKQKSE